MVRKSTIKSKDTIQDGLVFDPIHREVVQGCHSIEYKRDGFVNGEKDLYSGMMNRWVDWTFNRPILNT